MLRRVQAEVPYHLQRQMSKIMMKNAEQADAACERGETFQSFKHRDRPERAVLKCGFALLDGVTWLLIHNPGEFIVHLHTIRFGVKLYAAKPI